MKRIFAAVLTIAALSGASANAADLAARPYTKAPAMVAVVYDWSGFYIGINGGGGTSHKCWDAVAAGGAFIAAEGCHNATGGTVGGQIGYRWQSSNWVFGLEGQGNWADFAGDNTSLFIATDRNHSKIDSLGLITGQVGYAWNSVLLYVKGGGAVVGDKYDVFDVTSGVRIASSKETRWGAAIGTGLEFGFAPNWSVGIEYDHLFLGHRNNDFTTPLGIYAGTERIGQDVDLGLVRLNYRFGGPLIAKY